ncbi:MAG: aminotransferase class V-fold PLP-dependent enzyme [Bacteriovoracales bacterium]|nr:aminotransferase class V-fold PLP-dependent enzyme [Bacteriovoracales bacterium]
MPETIYADYNGHAPPCPPVRDYLLNRIEGDDFANPNASHRLGEKVHLLMEKSRKKCADVLGAQKEQILFNSCASEGISHIFHSLLDTRGPFEGKKIIISSVEHHVVLDTARFWQRKGYEVIQIPCNSDGMVDLDELNIHLEQSHKDIALVSIMAANNETGVIFPFKKMALLCGNYKIPFVCDTTQYIGKEPFDFHQSGLDFAVSSSHKVGGLIGSGLVLAKDMGRLKPFIFGGGQEGGLRGGTQNYIAHETYGLALNYFEENKHQIDLARKKRDEFEKELKAQVSDCLIIGEKSPRISTTSMLAFPGLSGRKIQLALERKGIMVTTSSACCDKKDKIGHVFKAMGLDEKIGQSLIRVSLCAQKAASQYGPILDALSQVTRNATL